MLQVHTNVLMHGWILKVTWRVRIIPLKRRQEGRRRAQKGRRRITWQSSDRLLKRQRFVMCMFCCSNQNSEFKRCECFYWYSLLCSLDETHYLEWTSHTVWFWLELTYVIQNKYIVLLLFCNIRWFYNYLYKRLWQPGSFSIFPNKTTCMQRF